MPRTSLIIRYFALITLCLLCVNDAFCQINTKHLSKLINLNLQKGNSDFILEHVKKTPKRIERNILYLTNYLVAPFNNDYDKAMAIAMWIAGNIRYDNFRYDSNERTRRDKILNLQTKEVTPKELLKIRTGICGDYAHLFAAMCKKAGIKAYYITGHLMKKNRSTGGHAWNAFKYKNKIIYVDTTFMSEGTLVNSKDNKNFRISSFERKKAIKKLKKEHKNMEKNYTPYLDDIKLYFFDFTYEDETRKYGYERKETN